MHRNSILIYNGPDDEITVITQLNLNTVYEYSVVAVTCAGTSTAGVNSINIGGESVIIQYIHTLNLYLLFRLYSNLSIAQYSYFPIYELCVENYV